jgi:hypothetical protein
MANRTDDDVILTTLVTLELGGLFEWYDQSAHELAESLAHRERRTDQLREAFAAVLQRRPSENIETLLLRVERQSNPGFRARIGAAAAQLLDKVQRLIGAGAPTRHALGDIHREFTSVRFNYAINRIFSLIRWHLEWAPLAAFLANQIDQPNSEHTLVSFNYDLALERCLQETRPHAWSVRDGYGFEIHHSVRSDLVPGHSRQFEGPGGAFAPLAADEVAAADQRRRCTILKPHGSLGWLVSLRVPYQVRDPFESEPPVLCVDPAGLVDYIPPHAGAFELPMLQVGGAPPKNYAPYILPPGSKDADVPWIRETYSLEIRALEAADHAFVLGWSLPATDDEQADLIRSAVARRRRPLESLKVVNRNAGPEYFRRLSEVFGVPKTRVRTFNDGFQDFTRTPN